MDENNNEIDLFWKENNEIKNNGILNDLVKYTERVLYNKQNIGVYLDVCKCIDNMFYNSGLTLFEFIETIGRRKEEIKKDLKKTYGFNIPPNWIIEAYIDSVYYSLQMYNNELENE